MHTQNSKELSIVRSAHFFRRTMVDYRKFDTIVDTDSDEDNDNFAVAKAAVAQAGTGLTPTIMSDKPPQKMAKKGKEGRIQFEHEGRTIYEWTQNLTEVNIYIQPPPGVTSKMLDIKCLG